ncbi:MAG: UDP-3-O-(3-hydroxymyristoyl)glucosamine N-acyltransferase [Bacteroidetes bacterium]|nr:UDP-3-O-(3-hydroxymyristoyl)glucosamine N-acyltransferase [Bacteroidota bacterium]
MRFKNPIPLAEIASLIDAELIGDPQAQVTGINEIHRVESGDLVFVDHPKYYDKCLRSAASYIIINAKVDVRKGKALLVVSDPFVAYQQIVSTYQPFDPISKPIADSAVVGPGTVLMSGVCVGPRAVIGKDCIIHPNVVIGAGAQVGDRVVIQAGTVIGSDAFYYNKRPHRPLPYTRMLSCGNVIIEDEVEIGANCTIDRGVTHETRIGAGTKLDNLVQVGHDTRIGKNCIIAAQVGIAGATVIEDGVTLWGQVGISKTLTIGAGAIVLAQSGVPSSLEGGKVYFGSPVEEASQKKRELVWIKRIPQIWQRLNGQSGS